MLLKISDQGSFQSDESTRENESKIFMIQQYARRHAVRTITTISTSQEQQQENQIIKLEDPKPWLVLTTNNPVL
jgi:hypothetical protein